MHTRTASWSLQLPQLAPAQNDRQDSGLVRLLVAAQQTCFRAPASGHRHIGKMPSQTRIGLDVQPYRWLETGATNVRLSTLEKVVRGFGYSVSELLRQVER